MFADTSAGGRLAGIAHLPYAVVTQGCCCCCAEWAVNKWLWNQDWVPVAATETTVQEMLYDHEQFAFKIQHEVGNGPGSREKKLGIM